MGDTSPIKPPKGAAMSKHMPEIWRTSDSGGWSASHDGNGSSCYQGIKDERGCVIALVVAHEERLDVDPDTRANARLIAAVPLLLEALKDTTAHLVAAHSLLKRGGKNAVGSDKMFLMMLDDYEKSTERGRAAIAEAEEVKHG
jgi:hypothetical protein